MKIACLQFAPQVGDVSGNMDLADEVLNQFKPENLSLDLMVMPELAFTGHNFKSLEDITPCLEPTASGNTSTWAGNTALRYKCAVAVGYPEKVETEYYNSAIMVGATGETIANYRKAFLHSHDETWALVGLDGFHGSEMPGLRNVVLGISTDLNPCRLNLPGTAFYFAYHVIRKKANLVIVLMAWITQQDIAIYSKSEEPDMAAASHWVSRLEPIIRDTMEGEIIVVISNRCGTEYEAVYSGTSCVLGVHNGVVKIYGILGRGETKLLVVDTADSPQSFLVDGSDAAIPAGTTPGRSSPRQTSAPISPQREDTPFPFPIPIERPQSPKSQNTSSSRALLKNLS